MSRNPNAVERAGMTLRRPGLRSPGDYKPAVADDPIADALARVYALILSWPEPDAAALRETGESAG